MLDFNIHVQRQLIVAALDDFTPNGALPKVLGGQYGDSASLWREAVIDLVQDLLGKGLIKPLPGRQEYHLMSTSEIEGILRNGDRRNGFDVSLVWNVIVFQGTPKLRAVLDKAGLATWASLDSDLCQELGIELARIDAVVN
jgi:hypothetical protein